MPIETRSRTGKKPPPKPHFDDIGLKSKKAKPKVIAEISETDSPVAKKAKGTSKRRKVKETDSTASTLSVQSREIRKLQQLEVLTEDEDCQVIPQKVDMTRFKAHYEQLGELFQTLFTPDPELAAAYLRVEKETNRELKKLKEIKSRTKNEPAKAISHTPMGKKLLKMKGKRQQEKEEPEPIEEEPHDSSFESVASSKASVNFINTPVKTPGRALRSRKIRKSVLAIPKSPWMKERVTRAKAKKINGGKKEKPRKGEPLDEKKPIKPDDVANNSVIIISPSSSHQSQPDEEAQVGIEVKKNKKHRGRPAKRKVEESENEKEVFKIPSDFNFENKHKHPNPPGKKRILSEANIEVDPQVVHQSSTVEKSRKDPSHVVNQTLPVSGLLAQPSQMNHNVTTTCVPTKENEAVHKVQNGKTESSKLNLEAKSGIGASNAGNNKPAPVAHIATSNLNPVVLIERMDFKKSNPAKTVRNKDPEKKASADTTSVTDSKEGAVGSKVIPPSQSEPRQKSKGNDETISNGSVSKPHETTQGERTKKTSSKETGNICARSSANAKKKPVEVKPHLPDATFEKTNVGRGGNTTEVISNTERAACSFGNTTYYVLSPAEGNTTVYVDRPNETFRKPEQSRPNDTFVKSEPPPPNATFLKPEESRPQETFTKTEHSRPNDTFTKLEQCRPINTTVILTKDSPTAGDCTFTNVSICTPTSNATFVVPQKGDNREIQPVPKFQNCNSTYVLPKEQELKSKFSDDPVSKQVSASEIVSNRTFAVPEKVAVDTNGNIATLKKLPPSKEPPPTKMTKAEKLKPKLSGQDNKMEKNILKKESSSSSVCSSESTSSTTSKAESVATSSRGTPKSGKLRTTSKERCLDTGSHSKPPAVALELKKQEDFQRLEKKRAEGIKKKELYLQQKQEMQRKKNEEWKAKIEKKKAEEEAEKQAKADQDVNKGYVKTAVQAIYKLLPGQGNRPPNPALSKVMKSSAASAASCPDIHHAGTVPSASAASATSCSSMSNLKTQTKCIQIAQKVFGSVEQLQAPSGAAAQEKTKLPGAAAQPIKKSVPTKPVEPHKFLAPTPPSKKKDLKQHVDDIFDVSGDESFMTADITLDNSVNINTYDITVYEDLDENMEHRANKRIPDWANDKTQLGRSLFLQQPALLGVIRRPVFPQKNIGYKLFPNVPF